MSRSKRHLRAASAVVGTALIASSAMALSAGTASADVTTAVGDHGAAGVVDNFNGLAPAPGGGTYNVGFQVVSDANRAVLITKSKADGSLDTSFGTAGGRVTIDLVKTFHASLNPATAGAKEHAKAVAVDKLGRILVLGEIEGDQSDAATASDTDLFVARLHPNGALDTSFGTHGGWSRISLSDGVNPSGGTGVVDAAGYDIHVRANQRIVFAAGIGTDSEGNRTARDAGAVQLRSNGTFDTSFGEGGVASIATPNSDNLRRSLLDDDGSIFVTAYGSVGNGNQPFISKFDVNGDADETWGDDGLVTAYPGGSGGVAEAYGITKDADGNYIVSGYGYRLGEGTALGNGVDAILFSFKPNGDLNRDWGTNGFTSYHVGAAGNNSADRHRTHTILPDGRIVGVGASGPTGSVDALITVTNPDGTPGESKTVDLGATDDHLWGVTTVGNGYQVVAAGWGNGDAKLVTVDLTPAESALSVSFAKTAPAFGAANSATIDLKVAGAAAAGTVKVALDGKALSDVTVGATGKATVALPRTLKAGAHKLTASVAQAPGVSADEATATVNVVKAASTSKATLAAKKVKTNKAAKVTVKVAISGVPTGTYASGTVTVFDGSKKLKTVSLKAAAKGSATVTLPKLKAGTHKLKAVYSGNGDVMTSTATTTLKVAKK